MRTKISYSSITLKERQSLLEPLRSTQALFTQKTPINIITS